MKVMKPIKGVQEIPIPIYNCRIMLCPDAESWKRVMTISDDPDDDTNGYAGLTCVKNLEDKNGKLRGVYVVGIFDNTVRTYVHEFLHVSCAVLKRAGIDIRKDNNEALAYLTDYLVGQVFGDIVE